MSTSPPNMAPHYRKAKDGRWVVCGPVGVIVPGEEVTVHKRDGSTKTERIETIGRPFKVDGAKEKFVYGYPVERAPRPARPHGGAARVTSGGASPGQVSALGRMLNRLARVHQFDSFHGNGASVASEIRAEIEEKGGFDSLTGKQASELIEHIGSMIDDEM